MAYPINYQNIFSQDNKNNSGRIARQVYKNRVSEYYQCDQTIERSQPFT